AAAQRKCRQSCLINLDESKISFLMEADETCFNNALLACRRNLVREIDGSGGKRDVNALRSLHHVRIGHDVAVRVDDHTRPDRLLARDERGLSTTALVDGPKPRDQNLNHGGRDPRRKLLDCRIELLQHDGCFRRTSSHRPGLLGFIDAWLISLRLRVLGLRSWSLRRDLLAKSQRGPCQEAKPGSHTKEQKVKSTIQPAS